MRKVTLGALAIISSLRQCCGEAIEDDCQEQMADAWSAHDCKIAARSMLRLLARGVDLCENLGPPEMPRTERYSLGASAVVYAAERAPSGAVNLPIESGVRLEDRTVGIHVNHWWVTFLESEAQEGGGSEPAAE